MASEERERKSEREREERESERARETGNRNGKVLGYSDFPIRLRFFCDRCVRLYYSKLRNCQSLPVVNERIFHIVQKTDTW